MFRRILIPTDFSTASEWVFDDAVRIAGATGAEVIILHVRVTWGKNPGELRFPADAALYEYAEQQELARLRERVRRVNASVETRLVVKQAPSPGEQICEAAAEQKADLIVIATHARHHVAHLLVGSNTRKVIENPPAPVLAIRYGVHRRQALRKLIVPVHLKQTSHAALEMAAAVASRSRGEVHLITVCDDQDRAAAEELLTRLTTPIAGVTTKREIIHGSDIDKEILKYAQKIDADVIFLNARGEMSEVKLDIVRHATRPVMVVPAT